MGVEKSTFNIDISKFKHNITDSRKLYIYSVIFARNKIGTGKYSDNNSSLCVWNKRSSQNRSNEDISCRNTEKWAWNKFSVFIKWNIILTNCLKFFKKNWKIFYNGSKHCRSKFSYDRSDSSGFSCL